MQFELVDPEGTLLSEIADTRMKRDDIVVTYAMALAHRQRDSIDWSRVNHAIMDRWSLSALKYVKAKAWDMVHAKARERAAS